MLQNRMGNALDKARIRFIIDEVEFGQEKGGEINNQNLSKCAVNHKKEILNE